MQAYRAVSNRLIFIHRECLESVMYQGAKLISVSEVLHIRDGPITVYKSTSSIHDKSYFKPDLGRQEAEKYLRENKESYLVRRRSARDSYPYALSVMVNEKCYHAKIFQDYNGVVHLEKAHKFKDIFELISYYRHNSLKYALNGLDIILK